MRTSSHPNYSVVILSRADGEGSQDLLRANYVENNSREIPRFDRNDKLTLWH